MSVPTRKIRQAVSEFVLLSLLTLLAPLAVLIDTVVIGGELQEVSFTEIGQDIFLAAACLIFFVHAVRDAASRGFYTLAAALFLVMLLRELDHVFGHFGNGFWKWPVFLAGISSISYVMLYCRDTVIEPMANFIGTRPYYGILFGLIVVLVFSRIFGSGTLLWKNILSVDYTWAYKMALQEGLELFGYTLIGYGAFVFHRLEVVAKRAVPAQPSNLPRASNRPVEAAMPVGRHDGAVFEVSAGRK